MIAGEKENAAEFSRVDFSGLNQAEFPSLFEAKEAFRLDILRIFYALSKQAKGNAVKEIVATGVGASHPFLTAHLCQHLSTTLSATPVSELQSADLHELHQYAIPLGAALSGLPKGPDLINFRQGGLAYPHRLGSGSKSRSLFTLFFPYCSRAWLTFLEKPICIMKKTGLGKNMSSFSRS